LNAILARICPGRLCAASEALEERSCGFIESDSKAAGREVAPLRISLDVVGGHEVGPRAALFGTGAMVERSVRTAPDKSPKP